MRVATYRDIRTVALDDVAPAAPGPHDVVLDVGACGICGSDVHSWLEGSWIAPGMPMGHEFAGTVVGVGSDVEGVGVGDRIAVNPLGPCHACAQCRRGRVNLCEDASRSSGGGLGDRVLVQDARAGERVFVMPESMTMEEGAFLEPLSVAVRTVRIAEADLAAPILVTGLGTIGQCVVRVLSAWGARTILATDTSPLRRAVAAKVDGVEVLDPTGTDVTAAVAERFGTTTSPYRQATGLPTVIECSGAGPLLQFAVDTVRAGGTVCVVALTAEPAPFDVNPLVQKEVRLLGSFAYTTADTQEAFRLLAEREVEVTSLITHRLPLTDVNDAFAAQADTTRSIKVMVTPT
jgi:2-desacetyl-2-hydroxyethyl bacteriochlorophyllide A dehydrogenase